MNFKNRIRRIVVTAAIMILGMIALAAPASAETDTLSGQCIYVGGYQRGCASDLRVQWGSGLSWAVSGTASNTYRGDGWSVQIESMLNRKWSSNTNWMRVTRADDYYYYPQFGSISGYDPTYGAWVRLCAVNSVGAKYCNSSRYVSDNS